MTDKKELPLSFKNLYKLVKVRERDKMAMKWCSMCRECGGVKMGKPSSMRRRGETVMTDTRSSNEQQQHSIEIEDARAVRLGCTKSAVSFKGIHPIKIKEDSEEDMKREITNILIPKCSESVKQRTTHAIFCKKIFRNTKKNRNSLSPNYLSRQRYKLKRKSLRSGKTSLVKSVQSIPFASKTSSIVVLEKNKENQYEATERDLGKSRCKHSPAWLRLDLALTNNPSKVRGSEINVVNPSLEKRSFTAKVAPFTNLLEASCVRHDDMGISNSRFARDIQIPSQMDPSVDTHRKLGCATKRCDIVCPLNRIGEVSILNRSDCPHCAETSPLKRGVERSLNHNRRTRDEHPDPQNNQHVSLSCEIGCEESCSPSGRKSAPSIVATLSSTVVLIKKEDKSVSASNVDESFTPETRSKITLTVYKDVPKPSADYEGRNLIKTYMNPFTLYVNCSSNKDANEKSSKQYTKGPYKYDPSTNKSSNVEGSNQYSNLINKYNSSSKNFSNEDPENQDQKSINNSDSPGAFLDCKGEKINAMFPFKIHSIDVVCDQSAQWNNNPLAQQVRDSSVQQVRDSSAQWIYDPSAHHVCDPSAHQVCDPSAHQVCDPSAHQVCDPSAQQVCDPSAQQVCDPSAQHVYNPSAQQVCDPSAQHVYNPSAQQVCDPSAQQVCDPSAQQVCDPSAKQVRDPSAQQVCNPSAQQVRDPSAQQVCNPSSQQVCNPSSQQVCDPSAQQVSDPSAQQVCDPSDQKVCDPCAQWICDESAQRICVPPAQRTCKPTERIGDESEHRIRDELSQRLRDELARQGCDPSAQGICDQSAQKTSNLRSKSRPSKATIGARKIKNDCDFHCGQSWCSSERTRAHPSSVPDSFWKNCNFPLDLKHIEQMDKLNCQSPYCIGQCEVKTCLDYIKPKCNSSESYRHLAPTSNVYRTAKSCLKMQTDTNFTMNSIVASASVATENQKYAGSIPNAFRRTQSRGESKPKGTPTPTLNDKVHCLLCNKPKVIVNKNAEMFPRNNSCKENDICTTSRRSVSSPEVRGSKKSNSNRSEGKESGTKKSKIFTWLRDSSQTEGFTPIQSIISRKNIETVVSESKKRVIFDENMMKRTATIKSNDSEEYEIKNIDPCTITKSLLESDSARRFWIEDKTSSMKQVSPHESVFGPGKIYDHWPDVEMKSSLSLDGTAKEQSSDSISRSCRRCRKRESSCLSKGSSERDWEGNRRFNSNEGISPTESVFGSGRVQQHWPEMTAILNQKKSYLETVQMLQNFVPSYSNSCTKSDKLGQGESLNLISPTESVFGRGRIEDHWPKIIPFPATEGPYLGECFFENKSKICELDDIKESASIKSKTALRKRPRNLETITSTHDTCFSGICLGSGVEGEATKYDVKKFPTINFNIEIHNTSDPSKEPEIKFPEKAESSQDTSMDHAIGVDTKKHHITKTGQDSIFTRPRCCRDPTCVNRLEMTPDSGEDKNRLNINTFSNKNKLKNQLGYKYNRKSETEILEEMISSTFPSDVSEANMHSVKGHLAGNQKLQSKENIVGNAKHVQTDVSDTMSVHVLKFKYNNKISSDDKGISAPTETHCVNKGKVSRSTANNFYNKLFTTNHVMIGRKSREFGEKGRENVVKERKENSNMLNRFGLQLTNDVSQSNPTATQNQMTTTSSIFCERRDKVALDSNRETCLRKEAKETTNKELEKPGKNGNVTELPPFLLQLENKLTDNIANIITKKLFKTSIQSRTDAVSIQTRDGSVNSNKPTVENWKMETSTDASQVDGMCIPKTECGNDVQKDRKTLLADGGIQRYSIDCQTVWPIKKLSKLGLNKSVKSFGHMSRLSESTKMVKRNVPSRTTGFGSIKDIGHGRQRVLFQSLAERRQRRKIDADVGERGLLTHRNVNSLNFNSVMKRKIRKNDGIGNTYFKQWRMKGEGRSSTSVHHAAKELKRPKVHQNDGVRESSENKKYDVSSCIIKPLGKRYISQNERISKHLQGSSLYGSTWKTFATSGLMSKSGKQTQMVFRSSTKTTMTQEKKMDDKFNSLGIGTSPEERRRDESYDSTEREKRISTSVPSSRDQETQLPHPLTNNDPEQRGNKGSGSGYLPPPKTYRTCPEMCDAHAQSVPASHLVLEPEPRDESWLTPQSAPPDPIAADEKCGGCYTCDALSDDQSLKEGGSKQKEDDELSEESPARHPEDKVDDGTQTRSEAPHDSASLALPGGMNFRFYYVNEGTQVEEEKSRHLSPPPTRACIPDGRRSDPRPSDVGSSEAKSVKYSSGAAFAQVERETSLKWTKTKDSAEEAWKAPFDFCEIKSKTSARILFRFPRSKSTPVCGAVKPYVCYSTGENPDDGNKSLTPEDQSLKPPTIPNEEAVDATNEEEVQKVINPQNSSSSSDDFDLFKFTSIVSSKRSMHQIPQVQKEEDETVEPFDVKKAVFAILDNYYENYEPPTHEGSLVSFSDIGGPVIGGEEFRPSLVSIQNLGETGSFLDMQELATSFVADGESRSIAPFLENKVDAPTQPLMGTSANVGTEGHEQNQSKDESAVKDLDRNEKASQCVNEDFDPLRCNNWMRSMCQQPRLLSCKERASHWHGGRKEHRPCSMKSKLANSRGSQKEVGQCQSKQLSCLNSTGFEQQNGSQHKETLQDASNEIPNPGDTIHTPKGSDRWSPCSRTMRCGQRKSKICHRYSVFH